MFTLTIPAKADGTPAIVMGNKYKIQITAPDGTKVRKALIRHLVAPTDITSQTKFNKKLINLDRWIAIQPGPALWFKTKTLTYLMQSTLTPPINSKILESEKYPKT